MKSPYRQEINKTSEILLFGKFKHQTVQHILRTEPSYILWLDEEKIVKFPQEILDAASDNWNEDNPFDEYNHNYSSYYDD